MHDEGFRDVTGVDISQTVIEQMQARNGGRPGLRFLVMDVCRLEFGDASFELVLDKSTLDALYCGDTPELQVKAMLGEVSRVLSPEGVYLGVSYGAPASRLEAYQE
jgi:EEF1A lysine methyltransferase 4